jgi:hypothetical protein
VTESVSSHLCCNIAFLVEIFDNSNGVEVVSYVIFDLVIIDRLDQERSLFKVNRRNLALTADAELLESEFRGESLELDEEADRCLFSASARMSSRLTFRSEEIVEMEVSRCSVNLEAVMMIDVLIGSLVIV